MNLGFKSYSLRMTLKEGSCGMPMKSTKFPSSEEYLAKFMGVGSARKGPYEILKSVNLDLSKRQTLYPGTSSLLFILTDQ